MDKDSTRKRTTEGRKQRTSSIRTLITHPIETARPPIEAGMWWLRYMCVYVASIRVAVVYVHLSGRNTVERMQKGKRFCVFAYLIKSERGDTLLLMH